MPSSHSMNYPSVNSALAPTLSYFRLPQFQQVASHIIEGKRAERDSEVRARDSGVFLGFTLDFYSNYAI